MSKSKITIVRGPGLSKWEMQIYEPLRKVYEISAIGSTKSVNDISNINFPTKVLNCPFQYVGNIPGTVPLAFRLFGDTQWLMGFDQAVEGSDLVHSAELRNAYSLQAVRAKRKGLTKKVTLTIYENIPFVTDEFEARRSLKDEVIFGVDHFMVVNKTSYDCLVAEGVGRDKITLVPQAVDTSIFKPGRGNPIRNKYNIKQSDFVVLGLGRMVWEKGWYDIVRAAVKLKKEKTIKFLLVGGGPEETKLKDFIKICNVSKNVLLIGKETYTKIPDFFRAADLFVHPSLPTRIWNEQFGGTLIEAMATGLPIVATDSGGTHETVGANGGYLIKPQDFSSLADSIYSLCKDNNKAAKMGKRNRQIATRLYDIKVVSKKIKYIWDNLWIRKFL